MPNSWQQRFFTIKDGTLCYFEDDEEGSARGRLDLKCGLLNFSVGSQIENSPTVYTMQIVPPPGSLEEKWKLCADSKEDLHRWSSVIEKYVHTVHPPMSPVAVGTMSLDEEEERTSRRLAIKSRSVYSEMMPSEARSTDSALRKMKSVGGEEDRGEEPEKRSESHPLSPTKPSLPPSSTIPSTSRSTPPLPVTVSVLQSQSIKGMSGGGGGRKKRLKLNTGNESAGDEVEMVLAVMLCNLCVWLACLSSCSWLMGVFYVSVANAVLINTLWLRGRRCVSLQNQLTALQEREERERERRGGSREDLQQLGMERERERERVVEGGDIGAGVSPPADARLPGEPPLAGSTLTEVFSLAPNVPDHTWCKADHRQFNVRVGPEYSRFKKKEPSGPPLYEAVAVDVFCTKLRVDAVASRMRLPDTSDRDTHSPHIPPLFIVQIQIPSEPPPLFGSVEDGPGWAIVMYFKISEDSCEKLKNLSTAPPSLRLFSRWCERAPVDPAWRGRFKVINSCLNLEELGMPQLILSYNAKPVLIRRTGSLTRGPSNSYLEMDIHVHKFAAVAKRSIHLLSSRCGLMYMQIGFVIEGREEEELPETLFACVGVNRPQEERAEFLFDEDD